MTVCRSFFLWGRAVSILSSLLPEPGAAETVPGNCQAPLTARLYSSQDQGSSFFALVLVAAETVP